MHFLQLPLKALDAILYAVPATDLYICLLVNKRLHEIITTSTRLILKRKLALLGAEINPFCSSSTSECLNLLNESTRNWFGLTPQLMYMVHLPRIGMYPTIRDGVVFVVRRDGAGVAYLSLARTKEDLKRDPQWRFLDLGVYQHVTTGLYLYEHDLNATVVSYLDPVKVDNLPRYTIAVQLRRFTTLEPHPEASSSQILVLTSPVQKPVVVINIVGRHLALLIRLGPASTRYHPLNYLAGDHVFVYNWKTCTALISFTVPAGSYDSILFLDEHTILLPNPKAGRLDIFRIPSESCTGGAQPVPIVGLQLPTPRITSLHTSWKYAFIDVHRGTNIIADDSWPHMYQRYRACRNSEVDGHDSPQSIPLNLDTFRSQCPFIKRGEDALCVFNIIMRHHEVINLGGETKQIGHENISIAVHRKALLDSVEQYEQKPTQVSRRRPGYYDWTKFDALGGTQAPRQAVPPPKRPPLPAISISWAHWGPPVARCIKEVNRTLMWSPGVAAGERCVRLICERKPTPEGDAQVPAHPEPYAYHVLEFNKYLVSGTARYGVLATERDPEWRSYFDYRDYWTKTIEEEHRVRIWWGEHDPDDPELGKEDNSSAEGGDISPTADSEPEDPSAVEEDFNNPDIEVSAMLSESEWRTKWETNSVESGAFASLVVESDLHFTSASSLGAVGAVEWSMIWADEVRVGGVFTDEHNLKSLEIHHFG